MDRSDLIVLRQKLEDAARDYEYAGMTNTYGKTAAELVDIDIAYRNAGKRLLDAKAAYSAAAESVVEKNV